MLTRNDMARVIIQALYNMAELPADNHVKVLKTAKQNKRDLHDSYTLAHKILTDKVRKI